MAITLISSPLAKPSFQTESNKKPQRPVSFDLSVNVEYENELWCEEDCKRNWYSKVDYDTMKDSSYSLAKQIWKKERLVNTEDSYKNAILSVYDFCCAAENDKVLLDEKSRSLVARLVGKANSRTGLEKVCIREIAHDKRFRRGALLDMTLKIQASNHAGAPRSQEELLRLSSETLSRPSRMFASFMAQALESSLKL